MSLATFALNFAAPSPTCAPTRRPHSTAAPTPEPPAPATNATGRADARPPAPAGRPRRTGFAFVADKTLSILFGYPTELPEFGASVSLGAIGLWLALFPVKPDSVLHRLVGRSFGATLAGLPTARAVGLLVVGIAVAGVLALFVRKLSSPRLVAVALVAAVWTSAAWGLGGFDYQQPAAAFLTVFALLNWHTFARMVSAARAVRESGGNVQAAVEALAAKSRAARARVAANAAPDAATSRTAV